MKKHQWISKIVSTNVRKKTRGLRRRTRRKILHFESLEQRNLLASVSFISENLGGGISFADNTLSFQADPGQADIVSVSAPTDDALVIQVGGGDSILLQDEAVGNAAFVLSQSLVANDTLTINNASSIIERLNFRLGKAVMGMIS